MRRLANFAAPFLMCALLAPLVAHAQQQRVWPIGFLIQRSIPAMEPETPGTPIGEFLRALRELGYVDGKNVVIHWRSAEGRVERLPELASGLVQQKVDIFVAAGAQAIRAAQQATRQIPIVMGTTGDPVGSGFVKSLQRPGGNITGLSDITASDLGPKLLDVLRSAVPTLSHLALLTSPDNSSHGALIKSVPAAAKSVQVKVTLVTARVPRDFEAAFAAAPRERAEGLIFAADGVFNANATQIELAVNRRAARAVGITLPQDLLLRADRVIE